MKNLLFSLLLACGVVWIASATPRNDGAVAVDCFGTACHPALSSLRDSRCSGDAAMTRAGVWIASATPRNDGAVEVDCFASQSDVRNDGAVAVDCFASQSDVRNDGGQVVAHNAAEANWCGVYEYAFTLGDMKVNDTNAVQKVLKEQFAVQVAEAKAAGLEKEYLVYLSDDLVVKGMKHQLKFVADHGVAFFVKAKQAQPLTAEEQSVGEAYSAFAKPLYIAIEMSHPKHREITDLEKAIAQKHGSFVTQLIAAKALSGTFLLKAKALND